MRHLVFVAAGFAFMLFSGNLQAQTPQQGGMDTRPGTDKPVIIPKSGANKVKHEKMETRGNDVKLERSSRVARGEMEKSKEKPKEKPEAPKRNEK